MLWLKSCSRCYGDLYEGADVYGGYVACAQCGKQLSGAEEATLRRIGRLSPAPAALAPRRLAKAAAGRR